MSACWWGDRCRILLSKKDYASGAREDIVFLEYRSSRPSDTYNICSLHSHVAYPSYPSNRFIVGKIDYRLE
jgi:hypothetical protein